MMETDRTGNQIRSAPLLALGFTLILLVLASCAPASDIEPSAEPIDPTGSGAGLSTVEPAQDPSPVLDGDAADDVSSEADGAGDAEVEAEIVTPVVIDLGEVTAGEVGDGSETLQEMPQPGTPDPSVAVVQKAAVDLAERLGVDIRQIQLVLLEEAEWPDSSLGCAEQGESYLPVETTGYVMVFEANGKRSEYHADSESRIILCEKDS